MLNDVALHLTECAPLSEFGHILGVAFEINLGYSILLRLGRFATGRIQRWSDAEKLRIIPPLCEDPGFNPANVHNELNAFEKSGTWWITTANSIAIVWAIVAACLAVAILALTPYLPEVCVNIWFALFCGVFLLGATPIGVIIWILIQAIIYWRMRNYSKAHDLVIKNRQNANAARIRKTRQELEKKLKLARGKDARERH
jgi:hypothetical protein